ncbi:hypothetical protein Trydic_g14067 [Trypoxylus dichotomus]
MVKTKFLKKPKIIRSDRGGEYIGNSLLSYFKKEGILTQYTSPYTPQQNGVAERKNRSLIEMTRCMLLDAKLPYSFWAEANEANQPLDDIDVITRDSNVTEFNTNNTITRPEPEVKETLVPRVYQRSNKAMMSEDKIKWTQAMDDEMASIRKNDAWELCELPKDRAVIGCKWVNKLKTDGKGKVRFKARLVTQGFAQRYGVDYNQVFAPVVRRTTF